MIPITPFLKTWDTKTDLSSLLTAILQVKKKESENIIEFNMRFQRMLDKIPNDVKPADIVILTFYLNAFESQFGLSLKKEEPKNLQDAMECKF